MANRRQRKDRTRRRLRSAQVAAARRKQFSDARTSAIDRLHAQARALDSAHSRSKRHHWVPVSYLRHWATMEEDKRIRTTSTERPGKSFLNVPSKVANRKHLYRIELPEIDSEELPPLAVEALLGYIEGLVAPTLRRLVDQDVESITPRMMYDFAMFLAFQKLRSPSALADRLEVESSVVTQMMLETADDERRELFEAGGYRLMRPAEVFVGEMGQLALQITPHIVARTWVLFETEDSVVTCDEPVVLVPAPGEGRGRQPGVGTAGAIIFPIGPSALLVLFRNDLAPSEFRRGAQEVQRACVDSAATTELNLEVAMAAHSSIFESPDSRVGETYRLPPLPSRQPVTPIHTNNREIVIPFRSPETRWADPEWINYPLPAGWWSD